MSSEDVLEGFSGVKLSLKKSLVIHHFSLMVFKNFLLYSAK